MNHKNYIKKYSTSRRIYLIYASQIHQIEMYMAWLGEFSVEK